MTGGFSWKPRRPIALVGVLGIMLVLVLAAAAVLDEVWRDKSMPIQGIAAPKITMDDLVAVNRTRVFFGHQSVGENVLTGIPSVFAKHNIPAPPIEQRTTQPAPDGGFIAHEFIGQNERPLLKIEDFDKAMRSGMGEQVDVALMKLCYIDITSGTDVNALFTRYRDAMDALEKDYANVTFVHTTVPLTTEPGFKAKLKTALGGSDRFGQAENVMRERYNTLIRNEYGGRHLFDLAAIESTNPNGTSDSRRFDGQEYATLYRGYASDLGHLNQQGSEIAATAFLQVIAQATRK